MARRTSHHPGHHPGSRRRLRLAAGALLLGSPALVACGFAVQTNQPYQPSVGSNERDGNLSVLGATIVVAGEDQADQGTFSAGLVNDDQDTGVELAAVTAADGEHEITLLAPVEVGPDSITDLSDSGAVLVEGELTPGGYVTLSLVFDNGDEVTLDVPVVNDLEEFADVTPAEPEASPEAPTSSPSGAPESPAATPSAGPSSGPAEDE